MTIPHVHQRLRSIFHCTPPMNSTLFFQSGSEIMTKYLPAGQCMLINLWSVIAFDDSCPVRLLNVSQISYNFVGADGVMIRIDGPGNVYFSSHGNVKRNSQEMVPQLQSTSLLTYPMSSCLRFAFYLLILYLILFLIGSLIDEDIIEEMKRQLDQLEEGLNQQNQQPEGGNDQDL
jgi:hypothetical protein